jgi:hypothetical protein
MTRTILAAAALSATLGILSAPAPAAAEERVCRGRIAAQTVDNLRVPANARCVLEGTRVKGTVLVERNAVLLAARVMVIGNVQAEGAARVSVFDGSRVGGSVQVVQGGFATVADSRIEGSIQLEENREAQSVVRTRVGADIQAFQNRGGVRIARNVVDGNLQCKENRPAPTGGRNVVQGSKEDQCRRL